MGTSVGSGIDLVDPSIGESCHSLLEITPIVQCCTHRADHPTRCGFSPQRNITCGSPGGCSRQAAQTTILGFRLSGSSPLLGNYDEPEILRYSIPVICLVPLRDRCSFGRFPWLISQALSVTYMAGERRLYLERNCRLPESPAHRRRRNREGPASSKGLNSQRGFGPAVEPRRKSRPRSTSLHGSSPCKCQRLSTLRWDRLPPSRPSTKSGARAGGR